MVATSTLKTWFRAGYKNHELQFKVLKSDIWIRCIHIQNQCFHTKHTSNDDTNEKYSIQDVTVTDRLLVSSFGFVLLYEQMLRRTAHCIDFFGWCSHNCIQQPITRKLFWAGNENFKSASCWEITVSIHQFVASFDFMFSYVFMWNLTKSYQTIANYEWSERSKLLSSFYKTIALPSKLQVTWSW